MKKILGLLIFYVIAIAILFIVTDLDITVLYSVNYLYVAVSCLCYFIVVLLRGKKLQVILSGKSKIPYRKSTIYSSASQFISAFIPGRAGEILLSTFLRIRHSFNISLILPTLFLDKVIELVLILCFAVMSLLLFESEIIEKVVQLIPDINILSIIAAIVVLLLVVFILFKTKLSGFLKVTLVNIQQGLLIPIKKPYIGLSMVILSIAITLLEMGALYILLKSLIDVSFSKVIIAYSLGMIIGIISMVPGGQGTTEFSMVTVMMLWGYNLNETILPVIISRILTYFILGLCSVPVLPEVFQILRNSTRRMNLKRKRKAEQDG